MGCKLVKTNQKKKHKQWWFGFFLKNFCLSLSSSFFLQVVLFRFLLLLPSGLQHLIDSISWICSFFPGRDLGPNYECVVDRSFWVDELSASTVKKTFFSFFDSTYRGRLHFSSPPLHCLFFIF